MDKDFALFLRMIGYLKKNNPIIISDAHDPKSVWVIQTKDTSESSYIYMQNVHLERTSYLSYSIETLNNENIVIAKIAHVSTDEKLGETPPAWKTLQQLLQQHKIQAENPSYPEYAIVPCMQRLLELYPDIEEHTESEHNMLLEEPDPEQWQNRWDILKRHLHNSKRKTELAAIADCYWTIAQYCSKEPEIATVQHLEISEKHGIKPLDIIKKICAIQPISEYTMEY